MPSFEDLKIKEGSFISTEKWNDLVDSLESIALKIPTLTNNGAILNKVSVGTKPGNGEVLNYPFPEETIGVADETANLRLQSPNNIVFQTGVGTNIEENKNKMPLVIARNGKVGINNVEPEEQLHIGGNVSCNSLKGNSTSKEGRILTKRYVYQRGQSYYITSPSAVVSFGWKKLRETEDVIGVRTGYIYAFIIYINNEEVKRFEITQQRKK